MREPIRPKALGEWPANENFPMTNVEERSKELNIEVNYDQIMDKDEFWDLMVQLKIAGRGRGGFAALKTSSGSFRGRGGFAALKTPSGGRFNKQQQNPPVLGIRREIIRPKALGEWLVSENFPMTNVEERAKELNIEVNYDKIMDKDEFWDLMVQLKIAGRDHGGRFNKNQNPPVLSGIREPIRPKALGEWLKDDNFLMHNVEERSKELNIKLDYNQILDEDEYSEVMFRLKFVGPDQY
jgi:hypothetical protein